MLIEHFHISGIIFYRNGLFIFLENHTGLICTLTSYNRTQFAARKGMRNTTPLL